MSPPHDGSGNAAGDFLSLSSTERADAGLDVRRRHGSFGEAGEHGLHQRSPASRPPCRQPVSRHRPRRGNHPCSRPEILRRCVRCCRRSLSTRSFIVFKPVHTGRDSGRFSMGDFLNPDLRQTDASPGDKRHDLHWRTPWHQAQVRRRSVRRVLCRSRTPAGRAID